MAAHQYSLKCQWDEVNHNVRCTFSASVNAALWLLHCTWGAASWPVRLARLWARGHPY